MPLSFPPRGLLAPCIFVFSLCCAPCWSQNSSAGSDAIAVTLSDSETLQQLKGYLSSAELNPDALSRQEFADQPLTREECVAAEKLLWNLHHQTIRAEREQEHAAKELKIGELVMKYDTRVFGDAPADGHSLVISMHGGGSTAARVNEQQWKNQIRLYELEEGIYVAPRAPTDTWNMWHQAHMDPFLTRLIENMILLENVDPNRVYITGYSAGGDGVYQLAPRMADQLAAAAMMAGHPNETQPLGLRNLPFTLHMGGNDAAYKRNEIAGKWKTALAELQQQDPDGYTHWVEIHAGKGHWMDREDAAGVKWMMQFERDLTPKKVVWLQDDVLHERFYWLAASPGTAKARTKVIASRDGNTFAVEHSDVEQLDFLLRDELVDLDEPIEVTFAGQTVFSGTAHRTIKTLWQTIVDRGDPTATFSSRIRVALPLETPTQTQ